MDHWSASEPEALSVWIRLLCEANYEDKKANVYGQLVDIKRGQLVFGLDAFSARSGVSVKKLRRIIDMLIKDGMLGRQVFNKFSVITITCYDKYQDEGKQEAGKGQAEGKQRAAPKEGNKSISKETHGVARDVKSKNNDIDYQAIADAYNEALGDKLPACKALNEKRKRAIKKLLAELSEPTTAAAARYFSSFAKRARPFHFGENDRGWKADFDFVVRSETLLKTREGAL